MGATAYLSTTRNSRHTMKISNLKTRTKLFLSFGIVMALIMGILYVSLKGTYYYY